MIKGEPDPQLLQSTVNTKLGNVDAFVSHSWSDDGHAKFEKLHEWSGGEGRLLWLDKACIDQTNIDASLAALPIFITACKVLVKTVGSCLL